MWVRTERPQWWHTTALYDCERRIDVVDTDRNCSSRPTVRQRKVSEVGLRSVKRNVGAKFQVCDGKMTYRHCNLYIVWRRPSRRPWFITRCWRLSYDKNKRMPNIYVCSTYLELERVSSGWSRSVAEYSASFLATLSKTQPTSHSSINLSTSFG